MKQRVSGFRHRGDRLISKKLELLVDSLVDRGGCTPALRLATSRTSAEVDLTAIVAAMETADLDWPDGLRGFGRAQGAEKA
jgi:hypothetical protein